MSHTMDRVNSMLRRQTDLWRRSRKLMHHLAMPSAAASYEPLQLYESERLLDSLIRDGAAHYEHAFERCASAIVMRLNYGKAIETGEELYLKRILEVVRHVERVASPGAYLVDTFPSLLWLPRWLAPFKREAAALHREERSLFTGLLREVRAQMQRGAAPKCFAATFLEKQDEFGLSDVEGAYVLGGFFEAGTGTTAAAMMSFCLSMCHYPEWQARIQEEVDTVVGDERLPDFDDMASLPTVRAVAKETLRWRPVTAGGIPHELIKDDVYDGYFFPAGTNIHPNQWSVRPSLSLRLNHHTDFRPAKANPHPSPTGPSTANQLSTPTPTPSTRSAGSPPRIPPTTPR